MEKPLLNDGIRVFSEPLTLEKIFQLSVRV
jgi:hypothetical protein